MERTHDARHPGQILREYLPKGVALSELAKKLGVTRQALSALVNGRAGVSASMALRLEATLGTSAEMWINLQSAFDLAKARKRPPRAQDNQLRGSSAPAIMSGLHEQVAALCEKHRVRELSLFGSVLREDFKPDSSDVDAVVSFGPPAGESLANQYFDFKRGLEELFDRPVDLVEISAMPDTRLRRIIERTKVPVYVAPS